MHWKRVFPSLLLCMLLLSGCGDGDEKTEQTIPAEPTVHTEQTVGATASEEETEEPTQPGTEEVQPGTATAEGLAVTNGELVYTLDYDQEVLAGSGESGWFVASMLAKGYGTRYYAVNSHAGQVIEGEEGAPVVLCGKGLVRFVWKDADGLETAAYTVYFMEGEPQTYTLFAQIYDLDGQMQEERELLTWTQTEEDPYFTLVLPAMETVVEELGGGSVEGQEMMLDVRADGEDAVVYGPDGEALIRLPGVDATEVFAYASQDGSYVSVYRPDVDQTEFYRF